MDIKCPICKRKLGYNNNKNAVLKYFCPFCDIWVSCLIKDGKISYRINRPGR